MKAILFCLFAMKYLCVVECHLWIETEAFSRHVTTTTMANEFGSDILCRFGGLQSLLSPPSHVLSSSPHSQDSIEWWNLSVSWFWPNWWLFLEDKVNARRSENCSNVFVSDRQQTSRMLIIHLLFCTKDDFFKWHIILQLIATKWSG